MAPAAGTQRGGQLNRVVAFTHRHKRFEFRLAGDGALELYLDGCLRKRRERGAREPQYVWTNVELEWEEHHYVEARYWASRARLEVTVNGEPALTAELGVPLNDNREKAHG
jgi:hypothetical protein